MAEASKLNNSISNFLKHKKCELKNKKLNFVLNLTFHYDKIGLIEKSRSQRPQEDYVCVHVFSVNGKI